MWCKIVCFGIMKANARNIYFKDATLWEAAADAADELKWSTNQFVEETVKDRIGRLRMIVEHTNTGFSAYCTDFSAFTTGGDLDQLISNTIESLTLFFSAKGEPRVITSKDIEFVFV